MTKDQAQILLSQLGGSQFVAMTGAKNFIYDSTGLRFKIGRNSKGITHVNIGLNWRDTYDLEFMKVRQKDGIPKITSMVFVGDVYCDGLQDVFTNNTGLYTHL